MNPMKKPVLPVVTVGANRAARLMLPTIAAVNNASESVELAVAYVDPIPGRARAMALEAAALGVKSDSREMRVEDLAAAGKLPGLLVAHTDRPEPQRVAFAAAQAGCHPAIGYLAVSHELTELLGLFFVLQPDDPRAHAQAQALLGALEAVTRRGGSSLVFGDDAKASSRIAEPGLRRAMAEHFTSNVGRLVARIEPESAPLTISRAGQAPETLIVLPTVAIWRHPTALARDVLTELQHPIQRGESFTVAEISDSGVRLYDFRLRLTDARLAVGGVPLTHVAGDKQTAAATELAAVRALERSANLATTFTRTDAVTTSD